MTQTIDKIPRYALYLLLIFTPLARGAVMDWTITVIHMVTLVALSTFLIQSGWHIKWSWVKTPLDLPFLFLFMLCLYSTLFSLHRYTSLWAVILLINYCVIFYLIVHLTRTRSELKQLSYVILGVAVFLCVFGFIKQSGANPFPWWEYEGTSSGSEVLSSTFGNRNHLAGYLEMTIPLVLGIFITGLGPGRRLAFTAVCSLLLSSLLLTMSRGGLSCTALGLLFMSANLLFSRYYQKKTVLLVCIGLGLLFVLIVLSNTTVVKRIRDALVSTQEPQTEWRFAAWGGIKKMIQDHPYHGTGPGTFKSVYTQYQPPGIYRRFFYAHNDYLQFISDAGLPILPIIAWMMVQLYRKGFKKLKNPSRLVRGTTLGAMSGITAIVFHSVADFNLHIPANALLFTVLAAIVAAPLPKRI